MSGDRSHNPDKEWAAAASELLDDEPSTADSASSLNLSDDDLIQLADQALIDSLLLFSFQQLENMSADTRLDRALATIRQQSSPAVGDTWSGSAESKPEPVCRKVWFSKHIPRDSIIITAVLFLAVGIILGSLYLPDATNDGARETAEKTAAEQHVAILNGESKVKWVEGKPTSASDPRLWPGEKLMIEEGLIELKYLTGARVVIEGPAEYLVGTKAAGTKAAGTKAQSKEVARSSNPQSSILTPQSSSNSGFLKHGKLVARCETKGSKGFTVCTPGACVVDLGTEFGVDVDQHGKMQVAVLTGKVELISESGAGSQQRIRLIQDESATVETHNGKIIPQRGRNARFAAAMQSRLAMIGRFPTGPLFQESFSRTTQGAGESKQYETGLDLRFDNDYPGWTMSERSHAVDLDPSRRRNWAAMFWGTHSITSPAILANENGTRYSVAFEGGPGVYAVGELRTLPEDRIRFEVLDASAKVIHTEVYDPADWGPPVTGPGLLELAPHSFTYVGNGDGLARIRISGVIGDRHFNGTIDNVSVSVETHDRTDEDAEERSVPSESGPEAVPGTTTETSTTPNEEAALER